MPEIRLGLLDSVFDIEGPPAVTAALRRLVAPSSAAPTMTVPVGATETVEEVLTLLNQVALTQCRSFAVHAGVVAAGAYAVAFPAVSGAGKSTLTAACLRSGFTYVSDEALVLDWDEGAVRPYPKWLSLSHWTAEQLGIPTNPEGAYSHSDLGATCPGPTALRHIVLVEDGAPAGLTRAPRAHGALALLRLSFNHFQRPRAAFVLAMRLAEQSCTWRLGRSHPLAMAEQLRAGLA